MAGAYRLSLEPRRKPVDIRFQLVLVPVFGVQPQRANEVNLCSVCTVGRDTPPVLLGGSLITVAEPHVTVAMNVMSCDVMLWL